MSASIGVGVVTLPSRTGRKRATATAQVVMRSSGRHRPRPWIDQPWVSGFRADLATTAGSLHPNADGMHAVADQLVRALA